MTMAFFRLRTAAAAALLTATLASPALHAAEVWMQIPSGSTSGTLGSIGVTMAGTLPVSPGPAINPDYNVYDIWDNDATESYSGQTVYPNGARLYPASAKGNGMQYVASPSSVGSSESVTLTFNQPVFNPVVLVYSLDNSYVDFSATTRADGRPAAAAVVTNSSANFNPTTQILERNNYVASFPFEGCSTYKVPEPSSGPEPTGRGCGVLRFSGYYTALTFAMQKTSAGNEGVGFQVGYDPDAAAAVTRTVPTLAHGGLAVLGLLLATLAARSLRRRPLQG